MRKSRESRKQRKLGELGLLESNRAGQGVDPLHTADGEELFFNYDVFRRRRLEDPSLHFQDWLQQEHETYVELYGCDAHLKVAGPTGIEKLRPQPKMYFSTRRAPSSSTSLQRDQ